jgi:hypothetical protein
MRRTTSPSPSPSHRRIVAELTSSVLADVASDRVTEHRVEWALLTSNVQHLPQSLGVAASAPLDEAQRQLSPAAGCDVIATPR